MQATWLGQGGFLLEADGTRLAVDPYLSDYVETHHGLTRLMPPPVSPEELQPTHVVCTHDHIDHVDPVTVPKLAALNADCRFIGPGSVVRKCVSLGLERERLTQIDSGDVCNAGAFVVRAVVAHHSDPDAIGLVIRHGDLTIYISGDTLYKPDLADHVGAVAGTRLDWVLVCINGRLGNMSCEDAVRLVGELGPRVAVPMHYGMFAENTADPEPFVQAVAGLGVKAVRFGPGEPVDLARETIV